MKQEYLKELLKTLLNIDDIDVIKITIESIIEEIDIELNNKKDDDE
jgi:hypothetical protein